jgi:hypothetical protein
VTGVSLYEALDVVRVRIERIGGVAAETVVVVVGCFIRAGIPVRRASGAGDGNRRTLAAPVFCDCTASFMGILFS